MESFRLSKTLVGWFALVACLAVATHGCATSFPQCHARPQEEYLLVESMWDATRGIVPKVEVHATHTYDQRGVQLRAAAIRLPDSCLDESAAKVTGRANVTQAIAQTSCGVWLSELERALVSVGFRVVSWDALRQMERTQNLSTYAAAKQLGAEVVFVFNSLEASLGQVGMVAGDRQLYFHSDASGARGEALALEETDRAPVRQFVKSKMGLQVVGETAVPALTATLDTTAILTDSGESMWFYRYTVTKPVTVSHSKRFLFVKSNGRWWPAKRDVPAQTMAIPESTASAEDVSSSSSVAVSEESRRAQERLELVRHAAHDFVQRFRSGTSG